MNRKALTVEQTTRRVIEHKLLTVLAEDKGQVAILATEDDLDMLINALRQFNTVGARQWADDLTRLKRESFGK